MSSNYLPTPNKLTSITIPDDLIDDVVVSTVNDPMQDLANGIAYNGAAQPIALKFSTPGPAPLDLAPLIAAGLSPDTPVMMTAIGGGGGGGGGTAFSNVSSQGSIGGGGGGSGALTVVKCVLGDLVAAPLLVVVGAGGAGGAGSGLGGGGQFGTGVTGANGERSFVSITAAAGTREVEAAAGRGGGGGLTDAGANLLTKGGDGHSGGGGSPRVQYSGLGSTATALQVGGDKIIGYSEPTGGAPGFNFAAALTSISGPNGGFAGFVIRSAHYFDPSDAATLVEPQSWLGQVPLGGAGVVNVNDASAGGGAGANGPESVFDDTNPRGEDGSNAFDGSGFEGHGGEGGYGYGAGGGGGGGGYRFAGAASQDGADGGNGKSGVVYIVIGRYI